ncbi:MAG: HAD family hydrolase [Sneathiella sp.]|nr:HAD family hydrolase [Sneathiella sp.]
MPFNDIKAILFDKDGTLLHFEASWLPALKRAAMEAADHNPDLALKLLTDTGYDPDTQKVVTGSIIGAGNTQDIAAAWSNTGSSHKISQLVEILDRIFSSAMEDAVPVSGLTETIATLKAENYVLGVASSDSVAAIEVFLKMAGVRDSFDFVVGYDSGHGHKPDPGMLLAFSSAIGIEPTYIAMIGDNPQDLQMAETAGAGGKFGVLTGNSYAHDLEPLADAVLTDITSLPSILSSVD